MWTPQISDYHRYSSVESLRKPGQSRKPGQGTFKKSYIAGLDLRRILRTSNSRLLTNIQKVLKFIAEGHCIVNFAAKIYNFSIAEFYRAQKTAKKVENLM